MQVNPRRYGNAALWLGTPMLVLALPRMPLQGMDLMLAVGIVLVAAGLLLRLLAPDSRARYSRGGCLEIIGCGLISVLLVTVWRNWPQSAGDYHHNDGGDVVFEFVGLPFIWLVVTVLVLMFRSGTLAADGGVDALDLEDVSRV